MRRSSVSLAFVLATVGCSRALTRAAPPATAPQLRVQVEPQPKRALATGCRATPSTVYGDEPVVFEIEGPGGAAPAEVELLDQAQHALAWETIPLPGTWRPSDVPSGDFTLHAGSNAVTCRVTVNRELKRDQSRATQAAR